MAPMKRASKAQGGRPAKKASTDPVSAHVGAVTEALAGAPEEVVPATARALLCSLVDGACSSFAAERHPYQAKVVEMLEQSLHALEAHTQKEIETAKAKVDGVSGDKAVRKEALLVAEAKLSECEGVEAQAKEALAAAKADHASKLEELKTQKKAQAQAEAPFEGKFKDIATIKAALQALEELQTVGFDGKKMKAVLHTGTSFSVDSSLLDSLVHVIKKEPALRAGFDLVVLKGIEEAFNKLVEGCEAEIATGEGPRAERAAAVAAAEAAVAAAQAAATAAKEALRGANQEVKEAAAGVKAARKHAAKWLSDAKVIMDGYDALVAEAGELRSGALASFAALKELAPEPEPAEEAQPEGAEAAGAAE